MQHVNVAVRQATQVFKLTQLAYTREGSGYPLVLQHGYFGGAAMWRAQIDYFKPHFDVIAPNLAGFGESAHLSCPETIAGCAQNVLDLLADLGIHQFHLLGHSMGGMVVQQMAAMAGERISKLICYGTGPVGVLPGRFETLDESRQRLHRDGLVSAADKIAATWFVDGSEAEGFAVCQSEGAKATMQAALASLTAWEKWNGTAALSQIKSPTLIMWGDKDRSYGWEQPETLWRGIPNSSLAVLPGCAHNAHMEKPQLFNLILKDFLMGDDANNSST